MSEDAYVCTKQDYERVLRVFKDGSREYAAEDYAPHPDEVEALFLYALAVECSGAPGYYAHTDEVRFRAAARAGNAFIVAADSSR